MLKDAIFLIQSALFEVNILWAQITSAFPGWAQLVLGGIGIAMSVRFFLLPLLGRAYFGAMSGSDRARNRRKE